MSVFTRTQPAPPPSLGMVMIGVGVVVLAAKAAELVLKGTWAVGKHITVMARTPIKNVEQRKHSAPPSEA